MYITRVEIQNIRSIEHLVWEIDASQAAGWHVILGDNGSGKSTFAKAVVVGSIGVEEVWPIKHFLRNWISSSASVPADKDKVVEIVSTGNIKCKAEFDKNTDPKGMLDTNYSVQLVLFRDGEISVLGSGRPHPPDSLINGRLSNPAFIASFGPFRRFSGGDFEDRALFESSPVLRRHQTMFSERLALPEAINWLQHTQFQALEGSSTAKYLTERIIRFVNQNEFLPNDVTLMSINSSGVWFDDGNQNRLTVDDLSDGYRSVLSMTFELLRLLYLSFGDELFDNQDGELLVNIPCVVLIDEIDAHLHPTWQKQIGFWLTKHFPKIQFIVTTHSPLVCQAAERGTIFRLPTPGTDEKGQMLKGPDRDRLLYGDILDAYSTEAFGYGVTRSETSHKMLDRLSDLNLKEMMEGLSSEETTEQRRLQEALPTTASALPNGFRS